MVVTGLANHVKVMPMFAGYFGTFSYPFITFKYLLSVAVGKLASELFKMF
jgi:hypothetical protein